MLTTVPTRLAFAAGEILVRDWPATVPVPPLLWAEAGGPLRGPARLRGPLRRTLAAAGMTFCDEVGPPAVPVPPAAPLSPMLAAVLAGCGEPAQGILIGLSLTARTSLVHAAAAERAAQTLVVVPDTGAIAAWRRELAPRLGALREHGDPGTAAAVTLATARGAAWDIGWLGDRHELLVVDGLDLWPVSHLSAVVDGSAALHRLGFAGGAHDSDLLQHSTGLGPVVGLHEAGAPECVELRLPLRPGEREAYEAAWHGFFAAFDRFGAMRPQANFAEFVRWARRDASGRPGLLAWHRSRHAASWTAAKGDAVAMLLDRHRGGRVLLFTPDCASAYDLARRHLIMPVTAELPRRERDTALAAFARGELRVLAGPRLLDTGTPEGSADAGVLIGCCFSRAQRRARSRRVRDSGILYELLSRDTQEVGRARRLRETAAAATLALD